MTSPISRRDFLYAGTAGAGALAVAILGSKSGKSVYAGLGGGTTTVVARKNGSISQMVDASVSAAGGMGFASGRKVAVKVNGAWSIPEANTSPGVVGRVCSLVMAAGASQVTVYDHSIHSTPTNQKPAWRSIADAAQSNGAKVVLLGNNSSDYVTKSVPGVVIKTTEIAKVLENADVLVNVPKLKTHSGAKVTISLKNHLGTVRERGPIHSAGLGQAIADLNTCATIRGKHRMSVVDAINPMVTGGPSSGTYSNYNGIIAGRDPVAVDYVSTQIIRRYNSGVPENPSHISNAASLGLGTNDPGSIYFDEGGVGTPVPELSIPLAAAGLGAVALISRKKLGPSPKTE